MAEELNAQSFEEAAPQEETLSAQSFEEAEAEVAAEKDALWDQYAKKIEEKTIFPVKVAAAVKGGCIAYVDDIRAFIPASRLAAGFVENLEDFVGKEIDVCIIEADKEKKRLVLSGREAARKKRNEERAAAVDNVEVGTVMTGKVETIKDYGAFVRLENGLSGLVHVSQVSNHRVNTPADVLKEGDEVTVKVIKVENHKLSLSIRALMEPERRERPAREQRERTDRPERGERRERRDNRDKDTFQYKEEGKASTGLADLLKDIKLD